MIAKIHRGAQLLGVLLYNHNKVSKGQGEVSRPKNGLQLFCQFNLCFLFFKLSIVYKNCFTTSV
ncbi:hypothetical protein PGJ_00004110 [Porphyromonas gingivalis AJW4]|nr:hypothetical protein PGJ_00004110 [Porphyromonas gingivalis AJW4]